MIVLDTNVLSELMRDRPSATVMRWIASQAVDDLRTTTICEAELLYGFEMMPRSRRRSVLEQAAAAIFDGMLFERVLPFDRPAARSYATILAARRSLGRSSSTADAQIAAIAHSCGATLATRNVADVSDRGLTPG